MEMNSDVLVVGAGTAGLYFAGLMAKQGYRVVVIDRAPEEELGNRYTVIHVGQDNFARFGLPEPKPGDPDYVTIFHESVLLSALNRWKKHYSGSVIVLRQALLRKRMVTWAKAQGAQLICGTSFEKPLFNAQGKLAGAVFKGLDGELRVNARLSVDASGIPAVLRTSLPDNYGADNFKLSERDKSFVVLRYVTLKDPVKDRVDCVTTWAHFRIWVSPQHVGEGVIVGVGTNLSFDYADRYYQRFLKKGYLPEFTVDSVERCQNTKHRPPYSFVADGFLTVGDSACITNPGTGEGVPYAWHLAAIAAEEFGRAMKDGGIPARESVWNVNARYAATQGAPYASIFATRIGVNDCSEEENDYEFKHGIFYKDDTDKGNLTFNIIMGLLSGGLSFKTVRKLFASIRVGKQIFKHYQEFPKSPAGFDAWKDEADRLWALAGNTADQADRDLAKMNQEGGV
ncbi:geranylgeranyl reductase [Spirochaetia bacterium]|nr:geranylgeranyl reductase [Spirochaetia bacterium]